MFSYDFHTHILPGMDDGSPDVATSVEMLSRLKAQGVKTVVCTPHFLPLEESVASFLNRRQAAYDALMAAPESAGFPTLLLGAEVRLSHDLHDLPDLSDLCIGETRLLLVEFPYARFEPWMMTELETLAYGAKLVPVVAHVDRYLFSGLLKDKDLQSLLSLEEAVIQVNNDVVTHRAGRRWVRRLLKEGYVFLFGSDTHNLADRAPNFDRVAKFLRHREFSEPPMDAPRLQKRS